MNRELEILLQELDQSKEVMSEHSISSKIDKAALNDESIEAVSERTAFSFYENYLGKDHGWGTYFGPSMVWVGEDGQVNEIPKISIVNEGMLLYWKERSDHTSNPIMKARYSGLVWDLSEYVLGRRAEYLTAIRYVEALLELCDGDLCEHSTETIKKITRAYKVSSALNNPDLIKRTIVSAIALEDRISEDDKPGLWGFCFDLFVLMKSKFLTEDQESKLINDLEERLVRTATNNDPWVCESAGIPLASFYRSKGVDSEVKRIIEIVGECFEKSCIGLPAMQASTWYRHAHDIYIKFNMKDNAEKVSKKIAKIGPNVVESMQIFSYSKKVPKEKLDSFLESMISGGFNVALQRIGVYFLPNKDQIEKQVLDLAKDHPLSFLFTKTLQDHKGRPVATIGGLEDDLEGNTIHQLSQNMGMSSFFLRHSFRKTIEVYEANAEDIVDFVFESPIFEVSKKEIISAGVKAFLNENYLAAIHILVPQVEAAIRSLIELMGGATLKKNRQGGLQLRTFDDLLRDELIEECFGSNSTFYFRVLLTDQRGWNVRNDVCHGITPIDAFNYAVSDRLMHVLLCLARVRDRGD